ncbi:MarR family winged helix-turn-helix transcriptional regulator [Silvimonas amylolytica]|uniref:MarR family transcriptional regulator n=1 Tax=Silvimonas amylolytica TaxID=449663 RepID=A0ABQ2PM53_9NEIS|nr:MarR family winged helix-turn-helix transcriptional regulator [Silvimonas amylolytica]GGP26301.1 MarR family transcriptional regulator [Silvimonas amylolytica]
MIDGERNLLQQIGPTSRALYAAFETEVGHAMPRWRILQALLDMKEATQKELAHRLLIDPGALTRHMKQMEAEQLISRHTDPQDNRLTRVQLTASGTAMIMAAQPQRHAFFAKALAGLDPAQVAIAQAVLSEVEARLRDISAGRPATPD